MKASLFYKSSCTLAEGPFWHVGRRSVFCLDIEEKTLYEYHWNSGLVQKIDLPFGASMMVETQQKNLILGVQGGLVIMDLSRQEFNLFLNGEKDKLKRCNDGKCDSEGRLWFGTMDSNGKEGVGTLYCLHNTTLTKKLERLIIPNGMAWLLDNKRLYHIESPTFSVKSFFFDTDTGEIVFEKIDVKIRKELGCLPDGMAMDAKGMLWIA